MTLRPRHLVILCGVLPTVLTAALCVYRPSFLAKFEHSVYDTLMRAARIHPRGDRIVIVDIDERSLAAIGQWPWRRDVIGQLISRLRELGSTTIALDIVFAESDRYQGFGAESGGNTDEALADALRIGRVVVGYALTFDGAPGRASACVQHPIGLAIIRPRGQHTDDPFFRASGAVCSLP